MAPALLWLLDFLSLAAAALLLHPTKNFAPDQTCVLNLSSLERQLLVLDALCKGQRLAKNATKKNIIFSTQDDPYTILTTI